MHLPEKVKIVEVGLRDGLQIEPKFVETADKINLIKKLQWAGVKDFEVTSFVSPKWVPQLKDAEEVLAAFENTEGLAALVPNMRGYERARLTNLQEVMLFVSMSESHNKSNVNRTIKESLEGFREIVKLAEADQIKLKIGLACSFGCPFEGEIKVEQIIPIISELEKMGIRNMTVSDTIGVGNPKQAYEKFSVLIEKFHGVNFSAHFHDTRGTALANTLAAMQAGCLTFESSIGGLGGCPFAPGASGNAAT